MHELAALQAVHGQATLLLQRNLQLSNEFVLTRQRMPHQAVSRAVKEEGHRQGKAKGNAELFCQGNKCVIPWGRGASVIARRRKERESPDVTRQVVVSATLLVGLFAVCRCVYDQAPSRLIRCFIRLFDELDQFVVTKPKRDLPWSNCGSESFPARFARCAARLTIFTSGWAPCTASSE